MIKTTRQLCCLGAVMLGLGGFPASADEVTNLLSNPNFNSDAAQHLANWEYSSWILRDDPGLTGKVAGSVTTDTDGHHCLTISSSDTLHSTQMWWQNQDAACAGGSSYELTVSVKGTAKSGSARPTIGIYFMDASGKWLGFQEITASQTTSLSPEWQKIDGKVTAPENASKMGVRLGIVFTDAQADVSYKEPTLQKAN